uniref:Uncharacterized protein n=1 Tax=Cacopsylla melanoneura TaxID=428564 RepID=A0A8D8XB77_9HEMI
MSCTMPFFTIIRPLPCLMVLLFLLCRQTDSKMENSAGIAWEKELDVTGLNKSNDNGNWQNITQWLGRELCKGKSPENPYTCANFKDFVKPLAKAKAIRWACEGDKALDGTVVCWLRQKKYDWDTLAPRTIFEVQFWTDRPNMSHCRYATPKPEDEDDQE